MPIRPSGQSAVVSSDIASIPIPIPPRPLPGSPFYKDTVDAGKFLLDKLGMSCAQWSSMTPAVKATFAQPYAIIPGMSAPPSADTIQGIVYNGDAYCQSQTTQTAPPAPVQAPIPASTPASQDNGFFWGVIAGAIGGFILGKMMSGDGESTADE